MLPQYSGGLGILAGDHLKAASDLGVPIIGVGLLYRQGYFRQSLNARRLAAGALPAARPQRAAADPAARRGRPGPDRGAAGRPYAVRPGLAGPGRPGAAAADGLRRRAERRPRARDHRPAVRRRHRPPAGPGGAARHRRRPRHPRLLPITGAPAPEVFHTNEGHAGFLGLERIREYMADGLDFDTALERTRAGTVFTTHTPVPGRHRPVPARADRRPVRATSAACRWTGAGARRRGLRGRRPRQVQHGRDGLPARPARQRRLAAARRGVAGRCSTGCGSSFDTTEVPITSITNGVHHPTWVHRDLLELLEAPTGSSSDTVIDGYDWAGLHRVERARRSGRSSGRCARS